MNEFEKSDIAQNDDPVCSNCKHIAYCTKLCNTVNEWLVKNNYYKNTFSFSEICFSHEKLEYIIGSNQVKENRINLESTDKLGLFKSDYRVQIIQALVVEGFFSQRQRVCLWLYFYENERKADIARFLGVTPNCVSIYIKQAIRKLKKYIFENDTVSFTKKSNKKLENASYRIVTCARRTCNNTWKYDVSRPTKKFCSHKCYRTIHARKRRKYKPKKKPNYIPRKCKRPECNNMFTGPSNKLYCSSYCRVYKKNLTKNWKNPPKKLLDSWEKSGKENVFKKDK